jgi:hypothetical protein
LFKDLSRYQFVGYVLLAAGLHGLLLLLPVSSVDEPPPISEQPVKVVKLAKPQPKLLTKPPASKPLRVAPKPKSVPSPVTNRRVSTPPPPSLPVKPASPPSATKSDAIAASSQPQPQTQPKSTATSQQPQPTQQPEDRSPTDAEDLSNLAQSVNAQQTCNDAKENCWRVQDSNWRAVSMSLTQKLEQKGYQVSFINDGESDTSMKVFQVSKNSETYYLYFLNVGTGDTAYFQASTRDLSLEEAEQKVQGRNT